ncbi:Hypothetical predicted protein [Prunus dulcis]|uniref:Uncharacterized protein n=1 Tax=Prunus dulcis TaxID=3755 RepID=A0A5E4FM18_PRUDU|nr:Hypothetical predicted protein [Prunus dulcis]
MRDERGENIAETTQRREEGNEQAEGDFTFSREDKEKRRDESSLVFETHVSAWVFKSNL